MKTCTKCGEAKQESEFHKRKHGKGGLCSWCKGCQKIIDAGKYLKYANRQKETKKEWYKNNSHKIREYHLKHNYNLTPQEYEEMLNNQKGCCAICGTTFCSTGRRFSVDHCHTTGKVLGLLCNICNTLLGKAKDDIEILKKAISYLKEHNEH